MITSFLLLISIVLLALIVRQIEKRVDRLRDEMDAKTKPVSVEVLLNGKYTTYYVDHDAIVANDGTVLTKNKPTQ